MYSQRVPIETPPVDVERARALMEEAQIDALAATSLHSIYLLSGFFPDDFVGDVNQATVAVLPREENTEPALVLPAVEQLALKHFPIWQSRRHTFGSFWVSGAEKSLQGSEKTALPAVVSALKESGLGDRRIGVEMDYIAVPFYRALTEALPDIKIVDAAPVFDELRQIKTPVEIERLRKAAFALEKATHQALSEVVPGMTELDVGFRMRELLVRDSIELTSIFVGAGERGAEVYSWPTRREIKKGDVLRIDITGAYGMHHADISRNIAIGEARDEDFLFYRATQSAIEAAIEILRPGVTAAELYKAAVDKARSFGIEDYNRYHVGHGLGLQVHEAPILCNSEARVSSSCVLAIEAPYYKAGRAGYSPEDIVYVTDAGVERWTQSPSELPII